MIPADRISFNDAGTAWLVMSGQSWGYGDNADSAQKLDRPCDTCGGEDFISNDDGSIGVCDCIDGRHTFTIEVDTFTVFDADDGERAIRYEAVTYRVSVIPGMVLPIVDIWPTEAPALYHDPSSPVSEWWYTYAKPDGWNMPITLPPAAAPGMWAVKLKVHQQGETQ